MAEALKSYSVTYVAGDSKGTTVRVLHARNRAEARGKVMSQSRPGRPIRIISVVER